MIYALVASLLTNVAIVAILGGLLLDTGRRSTEERAGLLDRIQAPEQAVLAGHPVELPMPEDQVEMLSLMDEFDERR